MWTGNRVISDMTVESMEWINKRLRRKAYIWWNFPVSDYVRNHLLLGEVYGNSREIKNEMSGFMTNPMEHAQASKIAIFSVADYSWNVSSYDSLSSWRAAIRTVMPTQKEEFETFATHNSDLGPNGHLYRRKESQIMKPVADKLIQNYRMSLIDSVALEVLQKEFETMGSAAISLLKSNDNKSLIAEIKPWILQFEQIVVSGQNALALIQLLESKDYKAYWEMFLKLMAIEDQINYINDNYNRNPYQPGVKTASLVMKPLKIGRAHV